MRIGIVSTFIALASLALTGCASPATPASGAVKPPAAASPAPPPAQGAEPVTKALPSPTQAAAPAARAAEPKSAARSERDITFCTVDGMALKLDLFYPQKALREPAPVVVHIHGGSWSSGVKSAGISWVDAPELLARGFVVASLDYRLAPASPMPAQVEDVKCAIRFLRANARRYGIDPQKVGAWGNSAGGHLAAMLGVTDATAGLEGRGQALDQPSQVQAVAELCGPADLRGWSAGAANSLFGPGSDARSLAQVSPITQVSARSAPFLIFHGEKDQTVPPEQSVRLAEALRSAGVPAQMVLVKNTDHDFAPVGGAMSPSRAEISSMIADFFEQQLR
jgi:acetyl esterase/lipase